MHAASLIASGCRVPVVCVSDGAACVCCTRIAAAAGQQPVSSRPAAGQQPVRCTVTCCPCCPLLRTQSARPITCWCEVHRHDGRGRRQHLRHSPKLQRQVRPTYRSTRTCAAARAPSQQHTCFCLHPLRCTSTWQLAARASTGDITAAASVSRGACALGACVGGVP